MTREEKNKEIKNLTDELNSNEIFYLTDTSGLNAEVANNLRRACHKNNVSMKIVKNTLLKKAMEQVESKDMSEFIDLLKGQTALMISDTGNAPAKLIKDFRKKHDRPVIKGAFVEESVYIGDENLDMLSSLKSKEEIIGDIILLLQSPAKNVVSSLESGKATISNLLTALEQRAE